VNSRIQKVGGEVQPALRDMVLNVGDIILAVVVLKRVLRSLR
jgi:hypothetical protein